MTTATNFRVNTWSNIGTEVNATTVEEVLNQAKLNYEVAAQPIFTTIGDKNIEIPKRKAIVRDDGHIYNVLSDSYTIIQNKDAFDFINLIDDDLKFVKAGETEGGMIYMIAELHEMDVLGDKFKTYAIFQNSHNGRYQLAMTVCPLRIVCQNQFNLSFKESNSTFLIRHTKNMERKLTIATETLNSISHYMKVFNEKAQLFATQKISESNITKFLNFMFPTNETMSQKTIEKVEEEKAKYLRAYMSEDNQNFKGSAWGLINGLTDYITHQEYKRKVENAEEKRFVETIVVAANLNNSVDFIQSLVA